MKILLLVWCCLAASAATGQTAPAAFDGSKWTAPYHLDVPKGWGVERFAIPIDFAPSIPYKGVEDFRFSPGWGDVTSDTYWSYAFLWYLDGKPVITQPIIAAHLQAYYTGLVGRNIAPRKIPAAKVFPVKAELKATTTAPGDLQTFRGTIYMLDYMAQQPMTLHVLLHTRLCPGKNHTFMFTEISPHPFTDNIWNSLNALWASFRCDNP